MIHRFVTPGVVLIGVSSSFSLHLPDAIKNMMRWMTFELEHVIPTCPDTLAKAGRNVVGK